MIHWLKRQRRLHHSCRNLTHRRTNMMTSTIVLASAWRRAWYMRRNTIPMVLTASFGTCSPMAPAFGLALWRSLAMQTTSTSASSAIKQRYIGGVIPSGNEIIGHASTGYAAMEMLFHTSCACAKRMEKALIARVRHDNDIRHFCRNKSDGGEGMAGNAPIYFVYAAYTSLPPQKAPDFSRWHPS